LSQAVQTVEDELVHDYCGVGTDSREGRMTIVKIRKWKVFDKRHARLALSRLESRSHLEEEGRTKRGCDVDKIMEINETQEMKERVMELTRQITLRVLLELCDPFVEILLLFLAVLQRSPLQLRVVSLYSQSKLATQIQSFFIG
jgi:hypothetical protein